MHRKESAVPPADAQRSSSDDEDVVSRASDDGISRVSTDESLVSTKSNGCWIGFVKFMVVLIFMGALCAAFYYAISVAPDGKDEKESTFDHTVPYTPLYTQYCKEGRFLLKTVSGPHNNENRYQGESFFYQDNERKEIIHKLDNKTVVWVYEQRAFFAKVSPDLVSEECTEDPTVGYLEYLRQLSLKNMFNRHSEMRRLRGEVGVFVFDGFVERWEYGNVKPFLAQAFAAQNDGRLIGFHHVYESKKNGGWAFLGYRYNDMQMGLPPDEKRAPQLPSNCHVRPPPPPPPSTEKPKSE